jgi:hypothetical protein
MWRETHAIINIEEEDSSVIGLLILNIATAEIHSEPDESNEQTRSQD